MDKLVDQLITSTSAATLPGGGGGGLGSRVEKIKCLIQEKRKCLDVSISCSLPWGCTVIFSVSDI